MKKVNLVQLPNGNWVNPSYVTSVQVEDYMSTQRLASITVWCVMKAGYGTASIYYKSFPSLAEAEGHANEIAALINHL